MRVVYLLFLFSFFGQASFADNWVTDRLKELYEDWSKSGVSKTPFYHANRSLRYMESWWALVEGVGCKQLDFYWHDYHASPSYRDILYKTMFEKNMASVKSCVGQIAEQGVGFVSKDKVYEIMKIFVNDPRQLRRIMDMGYYGEPNFLEDVRYDSHGDKRGEPASDLKDSKYRVSYNLGSGWFKIIDQESDEIVFESHSAIFEVPTQAEIKAQGDALNTDFFSNYMNPYFMDLVKSEKVNFQGWMYRTILPGPAVKALKVAPGAKIEEVKQAESLYPVSNNSAKGWFWR